MKKTVIALSLAGLFSAGAMANPIDPDFGVNPNQPEQPIVVDPDFGVIPDHNVPEQPIVTDPDFGVTPDSNVPDRPEPVDPEFGVTPTSERELIADLQQQMNERFAEMDEQMDGVRAGMHAITNARPFVTEGEFAIGAGVGFSGSKEALAIGGAYGFNEKISVSGTFHYETSGKVSSSEVAGGVGIQYKF
ncbi:YadA-like family protein [Grimontia kaedaensis]|uniref:YadA-like family protein n=1 Tax=Grimontia kaedaensis TaxID=2872157 RepID=A0ABY4X0F8_9GAMM|nr:YadA-like family protein [Grimontia kaedaensis]USH04744.1 YadA-like family protein [Grimontia kaedaensis]